MRVSFVSSYLQQPLWHQWTNDPTVTQQWQCNSSGTSRIGAAAQCQNPCWAPWAPEQQRASPPGPAAMEGSKAHASAERISKLCTSSFLNAKLSQYQRVVIGRSRQQYGVTWAAVLTQNVEANPYSWIRHHFHKEQLLRFTGRIFQTMSDKIFIKPSAAD